MFRNENITSGEFIEKFRELKEKFDLRDTMRLDSEYHQQLLLYIDTLYLLFNRDEVMSDREFDELREPQMTNLNRLQKLKNRVSYRKDKHKNQKRDEDWG